MRVFDQNWPLLPRRPDLHPLAPEIPTSRLRTLIRPEEEGRGRGKLPADACLHELFEAQAESKPDADALLAGEQHLTYRELNQAANRVAHRLRSAGIRQESIVGIFFERSADMVIAILGVLKAGAAYLPLDPAYPRERLAFLLNDAQAQVILTQSSLAGRLRSLERTAPRVRSAICIDTDRDLVFCGSENPNWSAQPHDLAYIIHTSGSTGQPKGVAVEHRNAVALVQWADQVYSPRELSGVLAGVSICFDPSILDLFVPLCLGGKVIMAANTLALAELPAAEQVRLINSVPSVVRELLRSGGIPTSLETINLGGEPLSAQLVDQLYALPHVKRVYDLYGPTETATCSAFSLRLPGGPVTIGRPIAQTQIYILDEEFRPVPVGATGEMFIGGAGVTRGYLNHPDATAEKFVHLSMASGKPARAYRTGDLGRCRPDGGLEFVGRLDHQIKIRGFRVEPGEIESLLLTHPSVAEALVAGHEDAPGERRLVAYIVPRAMPAAVDQSIVPSLRSLLQDRLPDYMLPTSFVLLDRFELTPNGKIDRAALPAPARTRAAAGAYLAPKTPTEEMLCVIWADLLGLSQVGIDDDFFDLGGDSLLCVAMFAEVEERIGLKLPVEAMQQLRSIRPFGAFLDGKRAPRSPAADSPWVEVQPRGSRPPLFLVHGVGGGMLWGYANLARHLGTDQPVYMFKACPLDRLREFDTIEKLAAYYVRKLREFQPQGPYALGGYCFGGNVAYEMARQLEQLGQRVSLLALMNSMPPRCSYRHLRRPLVSLWKFVRNLGYWSYGFLQWNLAKQWKFIRWKSIAAKKRMGRWLGPAPATSSARAAEEQLDLAAVPVEQRGLWEAHVRALDRHQTGPYGGKVMLLRTRGSPVNRSYEDHCGWSDFALGGVAVRIVPGLHESLLEEPYVKMVGRELKACLDVIQPASKASI
jgi:amino acid adenylation domain-containing protein